MGYKLILYINTLFLSDFSEVRYLSITCTFKSYQENSKLRPISKSSKIFQFHYIEKIHNKFSKGDHNIIKTPINISAHLSKNKDKGTNQLKYSQIIRNLMYIMNCTSLILLPRLVNWVNL